MSLDDIRGERIKKLEHLRASGLDPYPSKVTEGTAIADVAKNFSKLVKGKKKIAVAGRIFAKREHGGSTFVDIKRGEAKLQLFFKEDALGDSYRLFLDTSDVGDFFEVSGKAFATKRGEPTLEVVSWRIISKSLRPLPEKWHGLQDVEERFRKRYLDLLMNEDVRRRFILRSEIIKGIRNFLDKEHFVEVETPMLQDIPGGALARPFTTHHNALDIDLYLRIAPELYLKKLLIGGMEKVYELGKSFRNEGVDTTHNPEFTSVEWYAAYWDEEDMMACVEKLFTTLLKSLAKEKLLPSATAFEYGDQKIVFKTPFPRITFSELLKRYALIVDYDAETRESITLKAQRFGIDVDPSESKGKIADEIYKKICRPRVTQPMFITEHPLDISPLAKKTAPGSSTVRRFQLIIAGLELANAFSELNDPMDQRSRLEDQQKKKAAGDEESHPLDASYIEALEYGMPPAAGIGIGIDRLVMFLSGAHNIKEVIAFPLLKPKTAN